MNATGGGGWGVYMYCVDMNARSKGGGEKMQYKLKRI